MKNKFKNTLPLWAIIGLASIHIFGTCNQTTTSTEEPKMADSIAREEPAIKEIPFQIANRYFVKNTVSDSQLTNPKIETQEQFESLFGMATVMGEDGKPTPIDFNTHYVIAVIQPETDKATILSPNNIISDGTTLTLNYQIREGAKQSFTMRPMLILIVDKQYQGKVITNSTRP